MHLWKRSCCALLALTLLLAIPGYLVTSLWLEAPGPHLKARLDLAQQGQLAKASGWLRKPGRHTVVLRSILQGSEVEGGEGAVFYGILRLNIVGPRGKTRLNRRLQKPPGQPNIQAWSTFRERQQDLRAANSKTPARTITVYDLGHRRPDYNNSESLLPVVPVDWSGLGRWTLEAEVLAVDPRFEDTLEEILVYGPDLPPRPWLLPLLKLSGAVLSIITGLALAGLVWWRSRG